MGDYGNFVVKATIPGVAHSKNKDFTTSYSPSKSHFSPFYFNTTLLAFGSSEGDTTLEFTPTTHGAMMRVRFAGKSNRKEDWGFDAQRRISVVLNGGSDTSSVDTDSDGVIWITGKSTKNSGGVPSNFAHYFVLGIFVGERGDEAPRWGPNMKHADSDWAYADLWAEDPKNDVVTVRIGTSLISLEQARLNLDR